MPGLDERAIKRLQGRAWDAIRPVLDDVTQSLLSVDESARGVLTTIYIKFTSAATRDTPYAILWVRKSQQIILGLAHPEPLPDGLGNAPAGNLKYNGITGYLTLNVGDIIPSDLNGWVLAAYQSVVKAAK